MGLPTISKNEVYVVEGNAAYKLLFNLIPFGIWYLQHMGMARTSYKEFMQALTEKYVFFERSLFLLFAGIAVFTLTYTYQPIEGVLLELPGPVMYFGWGLYVAGLAVFAWSIIDMGETGPFGFGIMNQIVVGIEYPVPFKPKAPTRFTLTARHPLYLSLFMTLIGSTLANPISIGRVQFFLSMFMFIYVGTLLEEADILAAFPGYKNFIKHVPNKFVMDLSVFAMQNEKFKELVKNSS